MRIALIGAGNVGWHLGLRMAACGYPPLQVYSRTPRRAEALAGRTGAAPIWKLEDLRPDAELYILAVRDDAIAEVAGRLAGLVSAEALAVHTSGATPGRVLAGHFPRWGVFYPLQIFSRDSPVDFAEVPICVFAARKSDEALLLRLGQALSDQVQVVSDEERAVLHVAAVFVNNFTNALYGLGFELAEAEGLDPALLRPLLLETARKVQQQHPRDAQTGPARRRDQLTIDRHLTYLRRQHPRYEELYRRLTALIQNQQSKK
jgi:predicted short-subunit dehydrogenase-like oxidoreductase (DUF2520 family)